MALFVIPHCSPIIMWGKGRIKLSAKHSRHRVAGEKPFTEPLTPGTIACQVQLLGDLIGGKPLYPEFPQHSQAWERFRVMFRRRFRPCPAIAKGYVAVVKSLRCTFPLALTGVLGKHV